MTEQEELEFQKIRDKDIRYWEVDEILQFADSPQTKQKMLELILKDEIEDYEFLSCLLKHSSCFPSLFTACLRLLLTNLFAHIAVFPNNRHETLCQNLEQAIKIGNSIWDASLQKFTHTLLSAFHLLLVEKAIEKSKEGAAIRQKEKQALPKFKAILQTEYERISTTAETETDEKYKLALQLQQIVLELRAVTLHKETVSSNFFKLLEAAQVKAGKIVNGKLASKFFDKIFRFDLDELDYKTHYQLLTAFRSIIFSLNRTTDSMNDKEKEVKKLLELETEQETMQRLFFLSARIKQSARNDLKELENSIEQDIESFLSSYNEEKRKKILESSLKNFENEREKISERDYEYIEKILTYCNKFRYTQLQAKAKVLRALSAVEVSKLNEKECKDLIDSALQAAKCVDLNLSMAVNFVALDLKWRTKTEKKDSLSSQCFQTAARLLKNIPFDDPSLIFLDSLIIKKYLNAWDFTEAEYFQRQFLIIQLNWFLTNFNKRKTDLEKQSEKKQFKEIQQTLEVLSSISTDTLQTHLYEKLSYIFSKIVNPQPVPETNRQNRLLLDKYFPGEKEFLLSIKQCGEQVFNEIKNTNHTISRCLLLSETLVLFYKVISTCCALGFLSKSAQVTVSQWQQTAEDKLKELNPLKLTELLDRSTSFSTAVALQLLHLQTQLDSIQNSSALQQLEKQKSEIEELKSEIERLKSEIEKSKSKRDSTFDTQSAFYPPHKNPSNNSNSQDQPTLNLSKFENNLKAVDFNAH